jgi:hypothetical protein
VFSEQVIEDEDENEDDFNDWDKGGTFRRNRHNRHSRQKDSVLPSDFDWANRHTAGGGPVFRVQCSVFRYAKSTLFANGCEWMQLLAICCGSERTVGLAIRYPEARPHPDPDGTTQERPARRALPQERESAKRLTTDGRDHGHRCSKSGSQPPGRGNSRTENEDEEDGSHGGGIRYPEARPHPDPDGTTQERPARRALP